MFTEEEINILERVKAELITGVVTKRNALKARDIYNKHHAPIQYCMCSSIQRRIYAKSFIEWYESTNR
jgi:hypothetical protein